MTDSCLFLLPYVIEGFSHNVNLCHCSLGKNSCVILCQRDVVFSTSSGRNAGYRHAVPRFEEWEKNHGYDLSSDSSSDSGEESDKDKEKGR